MMYSTSLQGKKAWATGSSRGIGRKIAESGADVATHGRNGTNLAEYGEGSSLTDAAEQLSPC